MVESKLTTGILKSTFSAVEELSRSMAGSEHTTPKAFEDRKRFSRFTEDDARLLAELNGVFEEHADAVVDRFYEHLTSHEVLRSFLTNNETVARLKRAQRRYLTSLTSGVYDSAYAADRIKIGQTHDRIGLEPQWYLGTYGLYLDLLLPLIEKRFPGDDGKAARASAALSKLIMLDMQLVLDAYYDLRQRRAVERSEQLAAVGELAASIAHEVRNPLAGMKGALEVLRKELAVKPSNLEIVDELLAQIVRLECLVRDLLSYARPHVPSIQLFDLHDLLDRVMRLFKDQCEVQGITIQRIDAPGAAQLHADPTQIEQICLNLIQNALQAMEQGGTLTVVTCAVDDATVITFKDTGDGIVAADMKKIFQPFYTTKHRGSGLGLPIVKKIAEAHGGTVKVHCEPDNGTSVTLVLPSGKA